jgi:hypothetical protein
VYASSTTALATGSALVFDGTNLGIGTSSPAVKLDVKSANAAGAIALTATTGTNASYASFINTGGGFLIGRDNSTGGILSGSAYASCLYSQGAYPLIFFTDSAERARIDASGNLLINNTNIASTKLSAVFNGNTENGCVIRTSTDASGAAFMYFQQSTNTCGYIARVGTTSAVVYNTTSDYRLKTVVGSVTGHGERIDSLKPIDYLWKEGNAQARGFLAHEFQTVYPNSVTGEKDAVDANGNPKYQGLQASTSEVIADLVAEIQSLRKRITTLESK